MNNSYVKRVDSGQLVLFCVEAMKASGMREEDAHMTANILVTADLWGTFTHGTKSLHPYLQKVRLNAIDPHASPQVIRESAGWALIDGRSAIGMVTASRAMNLAIEKARTVGIAYVGVKNGSHFGAAGCYANMAAQSNMIGIAMSNADPNMTAPGGTTSIIGNNPLAFAIPAGKEKPIVLDIAMSAVAAAKIHTAKELGIPIPSTWIVDENGEPTADYSRWPKVGSMLPVGGHKGYGLALMVESLAAVVTGAAITNELQSWNQNLEVQTSTGYAFIAINVGVMMPFEEFQQRVDSMIRSIRKSPKARWANRIYLPGELEWEKKEQALKQGIAFPEDVLEALGKLARDFGMDLNKIFVCPQ